MIKLWCVLCLLFLTGCDEHAWNNPYPKQAAMSNTLYSAFSEQPKHLDPAKSYSANEWTFIAQIYEPPLQYHYIKRPYELEALLAEKVPQPKYDAVRNISTYVIKIKPGVYYQPHPAFALDANNKYYYHSLSEEQAENYSNINDFKHTATRELVAADYVYQIKRLADPHINSPIFGLLSMYIDGLTELRDTLKFAYKGNTDNLELDLRTYELSGATEIDRYTYAIHLRGKYPQFTYWLAMPFFAPIPWEATAFYAQPGLLEHNISLDWYPIGTGAYYLAENNPDRRMVLNRNPNFHPDFYPLDGNHADAGKKLPFVDQIMFTLEKESIPYWDKFLQGYYDRSGISSDNFNDAISSVSQNGIALTQPLIDKKIRLQVSNSPAIFYWAFNMLDETVGGYSDRAKKLRQAINLAFDVEEFITIFTNGRGEIANGPIPPEILGYEPAPNPNGSERLKRARELLASAGYTDGLQIYYEAISSGDPDEKSRLAWIRKQLAKIKIDLIVRATDYNRFMDKMRNGDAQMFAWGWNADYPDPENFLFLFYGPNGMVKFAGENAANYSNPEFDKLYVKFKAMGENPARLQLIKQMVAMLQQDVPWVWGYFPQSYVLYHNWDQITKPSGIANNTLKYAKVNPELRAKLRILWNKPLIWPFFFTLIIICIIILPAIVGYIRSEKATGKRLK